MFNFFSSKDDDHSGSDHLRIPFESIEQWPEIIELSKKQPVYIFKHSSRCGISSMVLSRFEKLMTKTATDYYYLHIQGFRSLSNWLEDTLDVRHESPQLIIVKDGKVWSHDSHYALLDLLEKQDESNT